MSFFSGFYYKKLADNEKNIRFWEDYLQNLKSLNFSIFADKLKVPTLVPIGTRIFFRGDLIHTNEVTVALGADYFAKCSIKQAEVLRQHRIRDAQSKLESFHKEKEYLENQMSFTNQNVYDSEGKEIVEYYTEEEDKEWRKKHRVNVRSYKQRESKTRDEGEAEVTDEELWNRLEELELQEELENEQANMNEDDRETIQTESVTESFVNKDLVTNKKANVERIEQKQLYKENNVSTISQKVINKQETYTENNKVTPKYELLQKVINKQYELEEKLIELRNVEKSPSKTEKDLITKLDEMERLDELEDELNRLDDIIETEDTEDPEEENTNTLSPVEIKRKVSFADEDDSETLELFFSHTDVLPCREPYDPKKGILKPSDIYKAFPDSFSGEATSILKKSKYGKEISNMEVPQVISKPKVEFEDYDDKKVEMNRIIEIKDVIEKVAQTDNNKQESGSRPTSLFKKKRQQMKS